MSELKFKLPENEYINRLNPIQDYLRQASLYISEVNNIDFDKSKDLVRDTLNTLKKENKIINPRVVFRERSMNGEIEERKVTTLAGYIDYVKKNDEIIAPSFTVYFNKKKKPSLHAEFIDINVAERSKHKKLAFKYKMEGDLSKFSFHNTIQKTRKVKNNGLSGGYASASTVLYNPTAHYTLTSITRCVSGIGNAVSESFIAGNRHYRNPEVTLNHLVAIIDQVDLNKIEEVIKEYNLHLPTPEEVMEHVIIKNIKPYWRNKKKEEEIFRFLKIISPVKRAAITYVNSLYHIRLFNPDLIRDFISGIINDEFIEIDNPLEYIKDMTDWEFNLLMHAESDIMRGKKFVLDPEDKDYIGDDIVKQLASRLYKIRRSFSDYFKLLKTLLITNVFPISIAYIKDMLREVIVLSDTDSTCATYQSWVEWYFGEYKFNKEAVAITAIVMTLVTQAIDHYIKLLGANMNIGWEGAKHLQMKNEFFWDVFVNTDVSKHYFANVRIQEGNVFAEPDLEKKGVHLIASFAYGPVRKLADELMRDILTKSGRGEKLSLEYYLKRVAEAEKMIIESIKEGKTDVLKLEKIKEKDAYKADLEQSPYLQYLLWQEVFADKYGSAPDPTYIAVKIPTIIKNKTDWNNWLNSLKDKEFKTKLENFMKKYGKTEIKTFKFPLVNLHNNGFPEEIKDIIDVDKVVKDNCNMLYMILNSLGYYLKPGNKVIDEAEFIIGGEDE